MGVVELALTLANTIAEHGRADTCGIRAFAVRGSEGVAGVLYEPSAEELREIVTSSTLTCRHSRPS